MADASVCEANRSLFAEFFRYEERKLKRQNGLQDLDEGCCKTLYGYTQKLRNVNSWFGNKPWKDLTREDIQRVYDALEDGTIRTRKGEPFRDRASYYNKVLKSKPFRLAGKSELTKEVIEFSTAPKRVVRYVAEEHFRRLVSVIAKPRHLLLLWLAWDIGENIHTLLQLTKREFTRQTNRHTGEPEYLVHLAENKLKRSRRPRSEVTVYRETARYADIILDQARDDEPLFAFGYRQAVKVLHDAAKRGGATSEPLRERIRWKDLRSGMACHLLRCGWTRDEVNARLGHTPRSSALDAYINFLALDRDAPKQRMRDLRPAGGIQSPQDGPFVHSSHQAPQPAVFRPPTASLEALQSLRDELLTQVRMVSKLLSQGQTPSEDPAGVAD
ncbi:MAG: hypothetical protein IT436_16845 [Phycisphaerales bacterium]|nr:hypothetical protein [Phycisphaerales bacterium]